MLSPEEMVLYRNLKTICGEPLVHDTIVKYAKLQYNTALVNLLKASDIKEVGKWQGLVSMWDYLVHLKDNVDRTLQNATTR